MTPVPAPVRHTVRLAQAAAPALAARLIERLFFTPPRRALAPDERRFLRTGRRFALRVDGRPVVGWRWGEGPLVMLVHGWGSQGARLAALARPLLAAGYRVVTFDAPGHGASGRGMSSMPEFARALRAVAAVHGPVHAVIAHSMGGAATLLAGSWGFDARRFVFLAPPVNPAAWVAPFAAALGLRDDVLARVRANSQRRLRFDWDDLDGRVHAQGMRRPLLVVHDWNDAVVHWADGAAIADAWPGAQLHTTRGLGHRGVLRDPATVALATRFVVARPEEPWAPPPGEGTARLEYELFNPAARRRG